MNPEIAKRVAASKKAAQEADKVPSAAARFLEKRRSVPLEKRSPTGEFAEVRRICKLPVQAPMTKDEHDAFCFETSLRKAYLEGWRWFPIQAEGIAAYLLCGGLFGPIGVGHGKTGLLLAIAAAAYRAGVRKILYLVPPGLDGQLVQKNIPLFTRWAPFNVPYTNLVGRSPASRMALAKSGRPGIYIYSYSLLPREDAPEVLEAIGPGLVLADECHHLRNRRAATTRVFMRFMQQADPQPQLVAVSGTITNKGLEDYAHLVRLCLSDRSPLPLSEEMLLAWSMVVSAGGVPTSSTAGPMTPLIQWARDKFPDEAHHFTTDLRGFRMAFQRRFHTAPGVVATSDEEVGASLIYHNHEIKDYEKAEGYDELKELMDKVENFGETPNGDIISHAIHKYKWLYELSSGFYNELIWPTTEQIAKQRNIDEAEAVELLLRAHEHHEATQQYSSALRSWFDNNARPKLDTPMMVGNSMARYGAREVGSALYSLWQIMKGLEFEGMPERFSRAHRVCDFKVRAVVEWVQKHAKKHGALIWARNREMLRWLYEEISKVRPDTIYCPADCAEKVRDPSNAGKVMVLSLSSYHEGYDLQHFDQMLFAQWPRSAVWAEQAVGRCHRRGQMADVVGVHTINSLPFDKQNFAATIVDALYQHQTGAGRQKLIYGDYDPLPEVYPDEWLRERGFENKILTKQQRQMLQDKFGE